MNAASLVLQQPSIHVLGWTLLHFLWQGALIAWIFAMVRLALRRRSANARYLAGCAALAVFLAAPVVTFSVLSQGPTAPYAVVNDAAPTTTPRTASPPDLTVPPNASTVVSGPVAFEPPPPATSVTPVPVRIEPWLPWLVAAWFLGVFVLSVRLLLGWIHVRRLRTRGNAPLSEAWQRRFEQLCRRMAVLRPVRLLRSSLVEVPAVIGCLRPVVLVPGSALTGLTSAQLESVLAHELAHIRRHDYLVNLLQNVIETLLFYHPAVWWVSRCVREERENCCDDLAVTVSEEPAVYAEALASLEELRHFTPRLALGVDGSGLLSRVRRILGLPDGTRGFRPRLAGLIAILGVTVVLTVITLFTALQREPVYYGKPVSTWIGMLGTSYHQAAFDVLTTAGDEVLPYLEKAIVARESWSAEMYRESYQKLSGRLRTVLPTPQYRHFNIVRETVVEMIPEVTSNPELAVPILLGALEHEEPAVRRQAMHSLQSFREAAAPAVPRLISMLDDPDAGMRSTVANSFRFIGSAASEAAPALVPLLNDEESRPRVIAAQTLGAIEGDSGIVVPALTEAAQSDHLRLRVHAIQSLGWYGADAESAIPVIAAAISDPELSIRRAAAGALASIGAYPREFESTIRQVALRDENPFVRSFATIVLWRNHPEDPDLTDALTSYIRWPDRYDVRSGTLHRLTFMEDPPHRIAPVLWERLEDDYAHVRRRAARILLKIHPEAESELARHIDTPIREAPRSEIDPLRKRIIEIMANNHFDADLILPELTVLLDDPTTAIAAARGIFELDWPNGRILADFVFDPRPYVQAVAYATMAENGINVREGLASLPEVLDHSEESLRILAATTIGTNLHRFSESETERSLRPALEAVIVDPNEEVRTLAARALERLNAE